MREKIEALAASLKFPLKKLFVVDGSTRSSHSNVSNDINEDICGHLKSYNLPVSDRTSRGPIFQKLDSKTLGTEMAVFELFECHE